MTHLTKDSAILIVGQGLAGSILALHFLEMDSGISVDIIDNNRTTSSSKVAAGIINPVAFKRLIPSWKAKEFVNYAFNFYTGFESKMNLKTQSLFQEKEIIRPFISIEEQNNWSSKVNDPRLSDFLAFFDGLLPKVIYQEYGKGKVVNAGKLEINPFLDASAQLLRDRLIIDTFDYNALLLNQGKAIYRGKLYDQVIFCEGYKYIENPFFGYLPHNCTKGEILHIVSDVLPQKFFSKGCFILPMKKANHFLVGATYDRDDLTLSTTENARSNLIDRLKKIGDFTFEIVDQKVGIRPTVPDRRPLIGNHPVHKQLSIFNGMGSKAVMLAPYLANVFVKHLMEGSTLDGEISIERYQKKYFVPD